MKFRAIDDAGGALPSDVTSVLGRRCRWITIDYLTLCFCITCRSSLDPRRQWQRLLVANPTDFLIVMADRALDIDGVEVLTPDWMNGSKRTQMEELRELWLANDPVFADGPIHVVVVASGRKYAHMPYVPHNNVDRLRFVKRLWSAESVPST